MAYGWGIRFCGVSPSPRGREKLLASLWRVLQLREGAFYDCIKENPPPEFLSFAKLNLKFYPPPWRGACGYITLFPFPPFLINHYTYLYYHFLFSETSDKRYITRLRVLLHLSRYKIKKLYNLQNLYCRNKLQRL